MRSPRFQLLLLAAVEMLAMAVWFSASALVPQLQAEWSLSGAQAAWMTMSVQLGFVAGAVMSALANLPDRWPATRIIALGAAAAALTNAAIPVLADGASVAICLRFATGVFLAMVYPPGMKVVASWTRGDRGLWVGVLVGALAVGSASPHLLNAVAGGLPAWRGVMWSTSAMAAVAAGLAALLLVQGPHVAVAAPFDWTRLATGWRDRPTRLANLGYWGHMWELYAVWAWFPVMLLAAYEQAGWDPRWARLNAFLMIASGGLSCVMAGRWADRFGRTLVTMVSLGVSGICALSAGFLFGHPALLTVVGVLWGLAVIADSAQFSAAVSELADRRYVGTALLVQTGFGFLLTLVTLRLVPMVAEAQGWGPAFALLALGPVLGIGAMGRLRRLPDSRRMASGKR